MDHDDEAFDEWWSKNRLPVEKGTLRRGWRLGAAAARARIREELWRRFDDLTVYAVWENGGSRAVNAPYIARADLNEALSEICPAQETTSPSGE